tara:strand:- start:1024 stop:1128 length:105 start_codon:yes stop_codon:yes gene_type:complete
MVDRMDGLELGGDIHFSQQKVAKFGQVGQSKKTN